MNRPIRQLATLATLMFLVLMVAATSPVVLARAGILKKRPATVINGPPIRELLKADVKFEDKPVVFLDRIVTARYLKSCVQ